MTDNYYACPTCGCNSYFMRRKKQICHNCDRSETIALNEALNLIAKYVEDNLPDDWHVIIRCDSDECHVELLNPEYDDVEFASDDMNALQAACDAAHEAMEFA